MQSTDHPELQFVQAEGFTKGRPDGKPLWIVIHDMEASETATRAENTAIYFSNPPDGRNVSSHYCVDNNSIVQCVLLKDSAWTVGNRPGNNRGINWELSGFASQSRNQWLDDFGIAMFNIMVPIITSDAQKYGIPLERRTVDELKSWKPGITSHNDLRLAFGGTTHTDPGANFPWDYFLGLLNGDDEMAENFQFNADAHGFALTQMKAKYDVIAGGNAPAPTVEVANVLANEIVGMKDQLTAMQAQLDEIKAMIAAGGGGTLAPHIHEVGLFNTGSAIPEE
jgi:N-acetyl-anhydromuramyl-L-alanine amidase AmpD